MKSENHWRCRECRTEFKEGDVHVRRYCSRVPPGPGDFGLCPVCGIRRSFEYIGPPYVPPADAPKFRGPVLKRVEFPLFDNEQVKPAPPLRDFLSFGDPGRKPTRIRSDETFRNTITWTRDQLRKLANVDCPTCLGTGVVEAIETGPCECCRKGEIR